MKYRLDDGLAVRYISELPKEQRPQTRLREDPGKVSDLGLICTIIGTDDPIKGCDILELINCGKESEIPNTGISPRQADKILAALEFARRRNCQGFKANHPSEVFNRVRHYGYAKQEHFIVLAMDAAYQVVSEEVVSVGLVNRTLVHPREVFSTPLKERATAVVLAHNHPSGNLEPSPDDLEITHRLKKAGSLIGIEVLDHIIFSSDAYRSMMECGEFI